MLAANFLTAAELHISEDLRDALITILGRLERGEFKAIDFAAQVKGLHIDGDLFAMNHWCTNSSCGTIRCIGGWAEEVMGRPLTRMVEGAFSFIEPTPPNLMHLFFPGQTAQTYATDADAAVALRNYLTTGNANWKEIVKRPVRIKEDVAA